MKLLIVDRTTYFTEKKTPKDILIVNSWVAQLSSSLAISCLGWMWIWLLGERLHIPLQIICTILVPGTAHVQHYEYFWTHLLRKDRVKSMHYFSHLLVRVIMTEWIKCLRIISEFEQKKSNWLIIDNEGLAPSCS